MTEANSIVYGEGKDEWYMVITTDPIHSHNIYDDSCKEAENAWLAQAEYNEEMFEY